jgi:hypothetical protein
MSARVPYLAGLLGGSRPPRPQDASLRPPRRLFAPALPFAQGLPPDALPATPTPAQTTVEASAYGNPATGSAGGVAAGADLARGRSLADATSADGTLTPAGSPRLHTIRSDGDLHTRVQEQTGWMPSRQPGAGARSRGTAAAGEGAGAPGSHRERDRLAGALSGDPRSVTSLTQRHPGDMTPARPFAAQSGEPVSSNAGRAGSELHTETGAGVARSGGIPSVAEGDAVSAALALARAARGLVERDRPEHGASDAALALAAGRSAAPDTSSPRSAVGTRVSKEDTRGLTSEAEPRLGSLIPAPAANRLGIRALTSDPPPESKQRGAAARVSIGTIEVTVVPQPTPAPPMAAGVGLPAQQPSAPPAHASNRPVADQLRLGARRWYGMAQA